MSRMKSMSLWVSPFDPAPENSLKDATLACFACAAAASASACSAMAAPHSSSAADWASVSSAMIISCCKFAAAVNQFFDTQCILAVEFAVGAIHHRNPVHLGRYGFRHG